MGMLLPAMMIFAQQPETNRIISRRPASTRPSNASNESQLAAEYYSQQQYDKAVVLYEKLYNENPSYVNYSYYYFSLIQLGRYNDAIKLVRKQIRAYPEKSRYLVDLGYIYQMSDEPARAQKEYEEALSRLPADRNAIVELAGAFQSRREIEYAIRTYKRGKELLGYSEPFYLEIGQIYEMEGKYEEMFNEYLNLIEVDPSRINIVQNRIQNNLASDPDGTKSELFRMVLLKRAQEFPDKIYYSEMLIWYSIQQKDFKTALIQAKALDRRFNEDGARVFEIGQLCTSNEDYDAAVDAFSYIVKKGESSGLYLSARIELLNASFLKSTSVYQPEQQVLLDMDQHFDQLLNELGYNGTTLSLMRNRAHLQAFYLNRQQDAIALLEIARQIKTLKPQQRAGIKMELADILLFSGQPWEATLLYSQVEKEFKYEPIGHEAKFRNARLSFYISEFQWAKAQLDVLKAATSKLIANDAMELSLLILDNMDEDSTYTVLGRYARADFLVFQNKDDQALTILDSLEQSCPGHPIGDDILYKKAQIKLREGKFHEADTILQELISRYPWDILADNALMMRASLMEDPFNDPARAMDLYQQLMVDYPGSLFVVEARKRFRELRGDVVN
ncbi:MAG: tetratricopeptide repeat protein [Bacteroidales bacterium]|nr:tetratricopeptide repeat protein [Lentimicrobiaceae bacterium]MDD5694679.1 tetratricopeptide repeat protein [Bacteroidales bacterium]